MSSLKLAGSHFFCAMLDTPIFLPLPLMVRVFSAWIFTMIFAASLLEASSMGNVISERRP